jgi:hypothetical protein
LCSLKRTQPSQRRWIIPAREAKLGWGMLVLPSLLMIGLVLLLFGKRLTLGFSLVALSVLLYMGFLFLELGLAPKIEQMD